MNRTPEFFDYLSRKGRHVSSKVIVPQKNPFNESANEIRQRLFHSRESVRELFLRLRRGNIFGEDEDRMNQIIISLNNDLSQTEKKIDSLSYIKQKPQNYKSIILTLQQNLTNITKDFQTLIKKKSELIQKVQERRQHITSASSHSNYFPTMYTDEVEYPMHADSQQLQQNVERYDMVRSVEQSINEITSMFQKLSEMIASHDYEIQRIDDNAHDAADNLARGTQQLEKFYEKTKQNRWVILKIALVLFVFVLFFILIL